MHKIVKQMGKIDLKNLMKIITLEKWLIMTLN
jgi:aryl carrier-like protein